MTGQIPPYGAHFRLVQLPYQEGSLASRKYELKASPSVYIRSNRASNRWYIFLHGVRIAGPYRTLTLAMLDAKAVAA